jgi:hypothetical protein
MKYLQAPHLLAQLGPQPLWLMYKCIPVWEDSHQLFIVGWCELLPSTIEDLSLMFGKTICQIGIDEQASIEKMIRRYAPDQPISELM